MKYKLYHGASPYLSLEAVHTHIDEILAKQKDAGFSILECDNTDIKTIFDTIHSPSLFSAQRVLFLKRVYRNKEKSILTEEIINFITKNNTEDILIIWEDQKIKSNTKYYKFFKENNSVEEVNDLNKRTFLSWLRKELEKQKLKIDPAIIKEFAERTNYDPERCGNEIEKFKLNSPGYMIRKEDLETSTADTLEQDIWKLIDAINQEDKEKSMQVLQKLSEHFTDANYILSMLARNLRLIYLTKFLLEQKKDYREISSILRIPPFTTPSIIKSSSKYSYERIKTLYSKLSNLDYQIKTGKINGNLGLTLICPYL